MEHGTHPRTSQKLLHDSGWFAGGTPCFSTLESGKGPQSQGIIKPSSPNPQESVGPQAMAGPLAAFPAALLQAAARVLLPHVTCCTLSPKWAVALSACAVGFSVSSRNAGLASC